MEMGFVLYVSIQHEPPYVNIIQDSKNVTYVTGFIGDIWMILQECLGFECIYFHEGLNQGIVELAAQNRDSLVRAVSISSSSSLNFINMSLPIHQAWFKVVMRDMGETHSSSSYILNYSTDLWSATLITGLTIAAATFFIQWVHDKKDESTLFASPSMSLNTPLLTKPPADKASVSSALLQFISLFSTQGSLIRSSVYSYRILLVTSLLLGYIVCQSYSALLLSKLAIVKTNIPFSSLDDIANHGDGYALCTTSSTVTQSKYFTYKDKESGERKVKKEWEGKLNIADCSAFQENHQLLCEKNIASMDEITQLPLSGVTKCRQEALKGKYLNTQLSIFIGKSYPPGFTSAVNSIILRLIEGGILHQLENKWLTKRTKSLEDKNRSIGFDQVKGLLVCYATALGVSVIVFMLEHLHHYLK